MAMSTSEFDIGLSDSTLIIDISDNNIEITEENTINFDVNLESDLLNIELGGDDSLNIDLIDGGKVEVSKDYNELINKPLINGVELIGALEFEDIGIRVMTSQEVTNVVNTAYNQVFGE